MTEDPSNIAFSRSLRRAQKLGIHGLMASAELMAEATSKASTSRKPRDLKFFPKNGRLLQIIQLLIAGFSCREISKKCGAAKQTVCSVRKFLEKLVRCPLPCQCGQPLTHRGWCAFRLKRSPARQRWLAENWHKLDKKL